MTHPLVLETADQIITQATTWRTSCITLPGGAAPTLILSTFPGRFQVWISQQNTTGIASVFLSEIATSTVNKGAWVVPLGTYHRLILPLGGAIVMYGTAMNSPVGISIVELARTPTP